MQPGGSKEGLDDRLIENRELFYLVLDQSGVQVDDRERPWDALAELHGVDSPLSPAASIEKPLPVQRAVFFDQYKLIAGSQGLELYDLAADPQEQKDLMNADLAAAERGKDLALRFLELAPEWKSEAPGDVDPMSEEEIRKLEALGSIHRAS